MARKSIMTVRYRKERNRYVFDVFEGGKKRQMQFPTRRAAEEERARILGERAEFGRRVERFSAQERATMITLRDRLATMDATIQEAVEFFVSHRPAGGKRMRFSDAVAEWRATNAKRVESCTMANYWHAWNQFARAGFGDRMMDTITTEEISHWLRTFKDWTPKTQLSYRANLSVLWGWAMDPLRGYAKTNPAKAAEIDREEVQTDVQRFTVNQCREYLRNTAEQDPEFVPYVVLSLFCGIRPDELSNENLDPNSGNPPVRVLEDLSEVAVMGAKRRTRRRRLIRLQDAPRAWLRLYPVQCPIRPMVNWRRRWESIRPEPWIQDGPRHTFATMHLAAFHDEKRLQKEMGHADSELIYSTYRGLATNAEAIEFYSLTPESVLGNA